MITNENYKVDFNSLSEKKLMYEFAEELHFDKRATHDKSTRNKTLIRLLKSPAFMASGVSTIFLTESPNKHCNRLKLILQEKNWKQF